MDKTKFNAGGVALVVSGLLALIVLFGGSNETVKEVIREVPGETLAAAPGPDFYGPYQALNDFQTSALFQKLNTVTTTPCAVQAPRTGTSTLVRTSVSVTTSSTTATVWHVAKATSAFATTTLLRNPISLGSGAKGTLLHVASTTDTAVDSVDVFGPGEWVVWGAKGFLPANAALLNGYCAAEFQLLSK